MNLPASLILKHIHTWSYSRPLLPESFPQVLWKVPLRNPGRWRPALSSYREEPADSALLTSEQSGLHHPNHMYSRLRLTTFPELLKDLTRLMWLFIKAMPTELPKWGHSFVAHWLEGCVWKAMLVFGDSVLSPLPTGWSSMGKVGDLPTPEMATGCEFKFPAFSYLPIIPPLSCGIPHSGFSRGSTALTFAKSPVA